MATFGTPACKSHPQKNQGKQTKPRKPSKSRQPRQPSKPGKPRKFTKNVWFLLPREGLRVVYYLFIIIIVYIRHDYFLASGPPLFAPLAVAIIRSFDVL